MSITLVTVAWAGGHPVPPTLPLLTLWLPPLVSVALLAGALASFAVLVWTIHRLERSLNARGESLFYPWRVRSPVRHARRIDGVLATSIRRLASGEDEVLATLHLHVGRELRGEARRHYLRAVDSLEEAAGRDWVFDGVPWW